MNLEEEAKKHAGIPEKRDIDSEERYYNSNIVKYDSFITGANSHAAKELWFKSKEFQTEKIKDQIEVLKELDVPMNGYITTQVYKKLQELRQQLKNLEQ